MASNSDERALERRLAAVERAVDGSGREEPNATDTTDSTDRADATSPDRESLDRRLDTLESRVDELDAALQAVRGFLGGIDAVNEAVESRADAAIAAVDRLERRLGEANLEHVENDQRPKPGELPETGRQFTGDDSKPENDGSHTEEMTAETERTLRERLSDQW